MCQNNAPINKTYLPLSSGDRIRRLKQKCVAQFKTANPTIPDGGISSFPASTLLLERLGQQDFIVTNATGVYSTDAGCCCLPVCPVSTLEENTPFVSGRVFYYDASGNVDPSGNIDSGFQEVLNEIYGEPVTIPPRPAGYSLDFLLALLYPPYCNSTSRIVNFVDGSGNIIPSQNTDLGPVDLDVSGGPISTIGGVIILFPSTMDGVEGVTLTASNSCSSSTGDAVLFCFLAGSPVTLADGSTKPIETIMVGDRVVGAFGEINTVTGLQVNPLGLATISQINGDHKTTSHHPHVSPDHKFCCIQPTTVSSFAYGKNHWVTLEDGRKEKRVMKGVSPSRIVKLEVGMELQTLTGPRTVTSIEKIPMSPMTPVYHLAVDGSHTYTVDGYAVVGWADETDFDYDAWVPKA